MSSIIKTRSSSYKLIVPNSRINAHAKYFSVRIINVWNRLSDEMMNASSISSFNYKLIRTDLKFGHIGKPKQYFNYNYIQCAYKFVNLCYQTLSLF